MLLLPTSDALGFDADLSAVAIDCPCPFGDDDDVIAACIILQLDQGLLNTIAVKSIRGFQLLVPGFKKVSTTTTTTTTTMEPKVAEPEPTKEVPISSQCQSILVLVSMVSFRSYAGSHWSPNLFAISSLISFAACLLTF